MPFAKGKPKTGGRKKGVTNRLNVEARVRLEELACDPLQGMATIAADTGASLELRGAMYKELAKYVWPQRRSVEHSGPAGSPIQTCDTSSARVRLEAHLDAIRARLGPVEDLTHGGLDAVQGKE